LSNDDFAVIDLAVLPSFSNSDHCCLQFKLVYSSLPRRAPLTRADFKKADWDSITNDLSCVDWAEMFNDDNSDLSQQFNDFYSVLYTAIDNHVPTARCNNNNKARQARKNISSKLRKLYSKKRSLWRIYKKTRSAGILAKYKACCSQCRREIHQAAIRKESQIIDGNNTGKFYRYCNSKLNTRSNVGAIRMSTGELSCDPQHKADALNSYFSSVFTVDNGSITVSGSSADNAGAAGGAAAAADAGAQRSSTACHQVDFNSHIVLQALKQLGSKTSSGPDMIPSIFLKKQAVQLAFPLSVLFAKSFETGYIPEIWKLAYVTPFFQEGQLG
jgi:hypothetical protein